MPNKIATMAKGCKIGTMRWDISFALFHHEFHILLDGGGGGVAGAFDARDPKGPGPSLIVDFKPHGQEAPIVTFEAHTSAVGEGPA